MNFVVVHILFGALNLSVFPSPLLCSHFSLLSNCEMFFIPPPLFSVIYVFYALVTDDDCRLLLCKRTRFSIYNLSPFFNLSVRSHHHQIGLFLISLFANGFFADCELNEHILFHHIDIYYIITFTKCFKQNKKFCFFSCQRYVLTKNRKNLSEHFCCIKIENCKINF